VAVNWHLAPDEIAYLLKDSDAKALVVDPQFSGRAAAGSDLASVPAARRFSTGDAPGFRALTDLDGDSPGRPPARRQGQMMFYTSGTTGRPKGVRKHLPESAPGEITLGMGIGLRPPEPAAAPAPADEPGTAQTLDPEGTVFLVGGPLYHAAPIAFAANALDSGARLVLMDKWTPEAFLELVERHRVTNTLMVPTMFHRLLALPERQRRGADVSSLRVVAHMGAPCPVEVKRRMLEWWGPIITESYSSTEGAGTSVTAEEWLQRPGTVGRPAPGVTLAIVAEDGTKCPPGVPGLVYLTPTLWEFEYRGDPEKTRSARREGMFTVGDIGYVDEDGYLFLCDRQSEVIVSGGVNIYPAEIEAVLLAHPAVADAAVIGAPDDEWGEEVRAVVELRPGIPSGPDLGPELIEHCRSRIAHYKCPRHVDVVASLNRDPNGKLRRRAIRDPYWEGRTRRI
jgi:long-chain acyl-CoA synthetase